MKKLILVLSATLFMSGCSARAVLVNKKVDYDPKIEARVRIYNKNGNGTTRIFEETSCKEIDEGIGKRPSKNPFSRENRHNGLPKRTLKNISVGMPLTEESAKALTRSSYFETTSFEEKVVSANKPFVAKGSFLFSSSAPTGTGGISHRVSCNALSEFSLEAGKDYELRFGFKTIAGKEYCGIYVNELEPHTLPDNEKVTAKVGKEIQHRKCKD